MKVLVTYVRDFLKEDFELQKYLAIIVFITFSVTVNYYFTFETTYVNVNHFPDRYIYNFLFYSFAYFGSLALVRLTAAHRAKLTTNFFLLSIGAMMLMAIDGSFRGAYDIADMLISTKDHWFVGRILTELRSFIIVILPLWIIWRFTDSKNNFYGITVKNVNVKPYLWLFVFVVPIVLSATQLDSFINQYPMYTNNPFTGLDGVSDWINVLIFESAYGAGFLSVELIFRGFLTIGMARLIGKEAILPMVVTYVFLHFEKPMGEAISAAIGGYLLGIFALRTNNIWGGVIIHIGLAWLMETLAWLVKLLDT